MLGEARGRGRKHFREQPHREAHAHPVDLCPGPAPEPQRLLIAAKLDADFGENAVRGGLDARETLLV